jgi:hypothetical protein
MQLILYANGNILMQYQTLQNENGTATVGISNADGTDGLCYQYNQPVMTDGLAIMFYAPQQTIVPEPQNVNLTMDTSISNPLFTANWDAVAGANSYRVYFNQTATGPWEESYFSTTGTSMAFNCDWRACFVKVVASTENVTRNNAPRGIQILSSRTKKSLKAQPHGLIFRK